MKRPIKVLVVEDEKELQVFLKEVLEEESMEVTLCSSIEEVMEKKHETRSDLIILDLMLKGERGEKLVESMRSNKITTPILVLSALGQIRTKIELINLGADDYLTKPFHPEELIARVKSLYRRYLNTSGIKDDENFGEFTFHRKQNIIRRKNKKIRLTPKESDLFDFLLRNTGYIVPMDDILRNVWKTRNGYHSNIIQSTIRRLRNKVDKGFPHKLIQCQHGTGYTLVLPKQRQKKA